MGNVFIGFWGVILEVFTALMPLVLIFLVFQVFFLKLPRDKVSNILVGMGLTFLGMAFFLQGVYAGFFPAGEALGEQLGSVGSPWMLITVGFLLGFVATVAEPAVRVLNYQVAQVSAGYIKENILLLTLSLGVACAVALAMVRIIYGIPLWQILIPGYSIALLLINFSSKDFVSIAFDAGG